MKVVVTYPDGKIETHENVRQVDYIDYKQDKLLTKIHVLRLVIVNDEIRKKPSIISVDLKNNVQVIINDDGPRYIPIRDERISQNKEKNTESRN